MNADPVKNLETFSCFCPVCLAFTQMQLFPSDSDILKLGASPCADEIVLCREPVLVVNIAGLHPARQSRRNMLRRYRVLFNFDSS